MNTKMRDFHEIFAVRPEEPNNFLSTRFAGLATLLTSGYKAVAEFDS